MAMIISGPMDAGQSHLALWGHGSSQLSARKVFRLDSPDNEDLLTRWRIVARFIDALNAMFDSLQYEGIVHKVHLLGTLPNREDWANELHPKNPGFAAVALKFNNRLYEVLQ